MSNSKIAKQIFQKWKCDLKDKNRSWANIYNNFDDLVVEWHYAKVSQEDSSDLFNEAIRAHQPSVKVAKMAYINSELKKFMGFDEFMKEWNEGISDKAWQAYYSYYKPVEIEEVSEPIKTGSVDRKEYVKQRRYADSFETIDPTVVQHQMIDLDDLEKALETVSQNNEDGEAGITSIDLENL